jgi:dissimilatory sulfite reductase related protein
MKTIACALIAFLKFNSYNRSMSIGVFDDEGFLINPNLWTEELSRNMAKTQFNITLTDQHSKIILYIRDYYKKWETLPMIKTIRDEFGLDASQIDEQFKRGSSTARGVICKLAGLPKMLCIASGC